MIVFAVILVLIASWSLGNFINLLPRVGETTENEEVGGEETSFFIELEDFFLFLFLLFIFSLGAVMYTYRGSGLLTVYGAIMIIVLLIGFGLIAAAAKGDIVFIIFISTATFSVIFATKRYLEISIITAVFIGGLLAVPLFIWRLGGPLPSDIGGLGPGGTGGGGSDGVVGSVSSNPSILIFFVLIGALVTFFIYVKFHTLFERKSEEREEEVEEDISATVDKTIRELVKGKDVRSTILRCYQRMCIILQESGVRLSDSMTAREFEMSAERKLSTSAQTISKLTDIFEKARYSSERLDEEDRKRALIHLRDLREELGV